jgi:hypothetical protein
MQTFSFISVLLSLFFFLDYENPTEKYRITFFSDNNLVQKSPVTSFCFCWLTAILRIELKFPEIFLVPGWFFNELFSRPPLVFD